MWCRSVEATAPKVLDNVKHVIESNRVIIFSKAYCPHCKRSKALFASLNVQPAIVELDQVENGSAIQNALLELTGQRTVPNIFINGKHLGGNDKAQYAQRSGELEKMLTQDL